MYEKLCEAYEDVEIKNIREFLVIVAEEIELKKEVDGLTDRQIMNILKKIAPEGCELSTGGKLMYRRK